VIELLIKTGAFSAFGMNRATLLANMEAAFDYAQNKKNESKYGQVSLFEDSGEKTFSDFEFTQVPEMDRMEQLEIEKQLIGFYFSGHPLDDYKALWEKTVSLNFSKPEEYGAGSCMVIGLVKELKTVIAKSGKMAYVTLEDYNGEMEITFFSRIWERCEKLVPAGRIACVKGKLEFQNSRWNILAEDAIPPRDAEKKQEEETEVLKALDEYRKAWKAETKINIARAEEADPKTDYLLIGILKSLKPFRTKNETDMAYGTFMDYNGEIGLTIFPKAWTALQDKLEEGTVTALRGRIRNDSYKNKPAFYPAETLSLKRLRDLHKHDPDTPDTGVSGNVAGPGAAAEAGSSQRPGAAAGKEADSLTELHIRLRTQAAESEKNLYPLRDFLLGNPGPAQVFIHIPAGENETVIRTAAQLSAAADKEHLAALEAYEAVAEVWGT
jgi:DNA polymerase-3 subunit alpha